MRPSQPTLEATSEISANAESYLAAIVESSDDAIVGITLEGQITAWNRGAEKIFGYSETDMRGQQVGILVPLEFAGDEERILSRIKRGESVAHYETVRLRRDGRRVHVSLTVSPIRNRAGEIIGASKISRDITEHKKITAMDAQLRLAIDAAPNGIVMIDEGGKITMVNAQMERMFGYDRGELIGQPVDLLTRQRDQPADRRTAFFPPPETRTAPQALDLFVRRKDGTEFPVELVVSRVQTAEGPFVLGAVIDVSARKKMEAELAKVHADLEQHALKLEATVTERTAHLQATIAEMESVSYSLSHDLRGPLRTIQGFVQLVLEDAGDRLKAEEQELLSKSIKAAHRLDRLIRDVLSYTRVSRQSMMLETVDVDRLLRQIIDERPELRTPHAEIEISRPLLPVCGHEASLTQVITNLLDNAVKFVPPDRQPHIRIHSRAVGEQVELCFEDNGIGIPREAQGRLFAIFQRVHDDKRFPGTGIGLAIVRKAAERMGGSVHLASEVGVGSRFCVRLPKGIKS